MGHLPTIECPCPGAYNGPVDDLEAELSRARAARSDGNEGMARVCARRAAGIAIRRWRAAQGLALWRGAALDHLRALPFAAEAPEAARQAAARLCARVARDHTLPFAEDPIDDAQVIVEALLGSQPDRGGPGGAGA